MTAQLHGARPVPITGSPTVWATTRTVAPTEADAAAQLRAREHPVAVPPVPDDHAAAARIASGPLRQWATAAMVGVDGGAGRTTVTRLLGRAFAGVRSDTVAAVDAVPLWGGLTAALAGAGHRSWTVQELAATSWPPPVPTEQLLRDGLSADGPVPIVRGTAPVEGGWPHPRTIDAAARRAAALVDLTLVDTAADPASWLVATMIGRPWVIPVWVCAATRDGLWGVGEAIDFFARRGMPDLVDRSVVAVVGHRRRWPRDAAAAEVQLSGRGLEILRVPFSAHPVSDGACARAAIRLLAAVVARSA